jgi:Fur family transcriptional regulator, ferric uptake regulator
VSEEALRLLRQTGGRITASRRAVVEVLLENGAQHITAEELAWRVRRRHPDIHRATVYRSLERLQEAGVVTHVHVGHGPSTFHLSDRPHHHAACRSCGTIIELASDTLDGVAQRLRADHGWELLPQHFALSALCPACT